MLYKVNQLELEEDSIGFDDSEDELYYLSVYKEGIFYNHKSYGHDAMIKRFNETNPILYWNIILS